MESNDQSKDQSKDIGYLSWIYYKEIDSIFNQGGLVYD